MNRSLLFTLFVLISIVVFIGATSKTSFYDNESMDIVNNPSENSFVNSINISQPAYYMALNGFYQLKTKGLLRNDSLITIIDFSKTSDQDRFYIIDLKNEKILKRTLVAHGIRSGSNQAKLFSNKNRSNKSSLGLFLTNETYFGKHGYSLRIDGMSKGLNDNARKRAIVIHGAEYVSRKYIHYNGRIGRSYGCPALPIEETTEIINLIKNGTCLYIYHPSLIPISKASLEKLP
ncbi:MAG: murein L,D-transpeptidase catalytic domain family protein [Bacteroidales bacterium]|nr:murein L,D-transpeptidase catalytic domain family protein [Bacteroidales bacterium]